MAFTQAPSQSTYQVKPLNLLFSPNNRDQTGTKDTLALNGFFDVIINRASDTRESAFVKRDGTTKYPYTCPSTNIRGAFFWEDKDRLYVAYNDKIDVVVASTGVLSTTLTPFTTTTGEVGFTEFYYDTGQSRIQE